MVLAPWQGGIWERLISCVKCCIKKAVGVRKVSFIELQTMMMEIEVILNNRPLCQDYDDDVDDVLTPNHLLYGRRLENRNENTNSIINVEDANGLTRHEKCLATLVAYFWNVWRKEYLTALRENQKLSRSNRATSF